MRTIFSEVFAVYEIREALYQALELHADTSRESNVSGFQGSYSGRSQPVLVRRLRERTPEGV